MVLHLGALLHLTILAAAWRPDFPRWKVRCR
jgi:hypothetical protein